ncbi:MAG TPA: hypothetical protein GX497_03475 [Bacillus bacterium]|nr:hypothetical protein [Bacillus sp. (in: firmicutes)]
MKKWKERIKFLFNFDELRFVFDKIILMLYFLFGGAVGGLTTIFTLKDVLNINIDEKFIAFTIDAVVSSSVQIYIILAFTMLAIVLIFRVLFLGIGKLIESMINKKQVKEDASL